MVHSPREGSLLNTVPTSGGFWLSFFSLIAWLMVPVGIVLITVGIIRYFRPREDDPRTILQRRYATGEISRSEFEELWIELFPGEKPQ